MNSSLSKKATDVIEEYFNLEIGKTKIRCPYYNNKTGKIRAGLRVHIGKGSAKDIAFEAELMARKENLDIKAFSPDELRKFLVDHRLGIECSGLTYQIIDAEGVSRGKKPLEKYLQFPLIKNPVRRFLTKLRGSGASAATFAHPKNSHEIKLSEIAAGDIVTSIGPSKTTGEELPNHILIIESTEKNENSQVINYVHAIAYPTDGKYGHGIRRGTIKFNLGAQLPSTIFGGEWEEEGKKNEEHFLYTREKSAGRTTLRRLNWL